MIFLFMLLSSLAMATEGYPPEVVTIAFDKEKKAFIKNNSCFPVTVYVNQKDYQVEAGQEVLLQSSKWSRWVWRPGTIGSMGPLKVLYPLEGKTVPDHGPDAGPSHKNEFQFSYDFNVPEGTQVRAMEAGVVVRIVQRYTLAHQDLARRNEGNKVEILHADGTVADYAHLKANSVNLRLCDKIEKGQLIGLSGNTGYSFAPHLHVDVIRPMPQGKFKTIPLEFIKSE